MKACKKRMLRRQRQQELTHRRRTGRKGASAPQNQYEKADVKLGRGTPWWQVRDMWWYRNQPSSRAQR